MSAIEVQHLSHAYPAGGLDHGALRPPQQGAAEARPRGGAVAALDDVSLTIEQGAFVSLVGPSGCGKSTLLRILAGLLVPDRGSATLDGRSSLGRPGLAAYMPQRDALLPWRRAIDNAVLAAVVAGADVDEARARARALFEPFGLAGFEQAWPAQLSGGMRQRLALLRTFLSPASTLLLDEPLGALDAITRRRFQGWLESVWLADRRTVLLVTHDVEEALLLSDRVLVMSPRPGRITATVDAAAERPRRAELVTHPVFVERKRTLLAALDATAVPAA